MIIRHGIIPNIISDDVLLRLKNFYVRKVGFSFPVHSKLYPLPKEHNLFPTVNKILLPILQKYFDKDIKIGICSYTKAHESYGMHFDNYQVNRYGDPYLSIILPMGDNLERFSTYVFNIESHSMEREMDLDKVLGHLPKKNKINDEALSHIKSEHLAKVEILGKYNWKKNSGIYWQNNLLHSSCKHPDDVGRKEFFIIHTYL